MNFTFLPSCPADPPKLTGVSADSARRCAAPEEELRVCGSMSDVVHPLPVLDSLHLGHPLLLPVLPGTLYGRYVHLMGGASLVNATCTEACELDLEITS